LRDVIRRTTSALPRQNTRQGRTPRRAFGGPMTPTATLCSCTKASHFWARSLLIACSIPPCGLPPAVRRLEALLSAIRERPAMGRLLRIGKVVSGLRIRLIPLRNCR